jgi:tetratricopeptide (TPR) repeat protein
VAVATRARPWQNAAPDSAPLAPGGDPLNRYTIIGLVVGLIVGVFVGYQAGSSSSPPAGMGAMPPGAPPPGMPGGGAPVPGDNFQARIAQMQQVVARDPKNVQAWVQLGNDYFDTRQPQKAIEAYGRALELQPNDADVLTDQGVMYRDVGQFDKAIANFQRANKANPQHVQSLFNMGVVYAHDMNLPAKAEEAWKKVIALAPQSEQAQQAQRALQQLRAAPPAK